MRKFFLVFSLAVSVFAEAQGYALLFNGSNENVVLPALNLNSNTLTIEAWVKPTGIQNAWSGILTGISTDGYGIMVRSNNELGFMWEDTHGNRYPWSSGLYLPADKWSYVALVITPTNATLYLNGTSVVNTTANDVKAITGVSYLGSDRTVSGRYFKGLIDEVRIWTVSRTDAQIKASMNSRLTGLEDGLKAYFKMDDQATALTDYSSNSFTGARTGTSYVANPGFITPAFNMSKSLAKENDFILLTDFSNGFNTVNSWKWYISGPENFVSTEKNPSIKLQKKGTYDVKLVVSDGNVKDSLTKLSSIMVAEPAQFDSLFFVQKKPLLTANWKSPFNFLSVMTTTMPTGPYMGNGDVGVAVHTTSNSQTLRISKVDFMADNVKFWNWLDWAPSHIALGGVSITANSTVSSGFNYDMDILGNELRMTTATTNPVKMKSWMAVDENVMITELTTTSATPISISVKTFVDSSRVWCTPSPSITSDVAQVTRRSNTTNVKWISRAGISTRILGATATLTNDMIAGITSDFSLTNTQPVYVVSYVSGGGKGDDAKMPAALSRISTFNQDSIARLLKRKNEWWKDMWQRSYVETNDDQLNRHYLSSIYQIASAHNQHSPTCGGMYGVWNMRDSMRYNGDLHLNYNSQASFYSSFSSNRPETAMPFIKLIYSAIPEGKTRAINDMGKLNSSWSGKSCKGILFPVSISSLGELFGSYWSQTMDAPFSVPIFSWYYEYTGDINYLRNYAYPYIKECGDFYESFIKKEDYEGSYRYTITCATHEGGWDKDGPADVGLMQSTFKLLLKYSKILGVDFDKQAIWSDILNHSPRYATHLHNGVTVIAKNDDGRDQPNHMIQLHPIYPSEIMTIHSNPDTIQMAKNTIDYFCVEKGAFGAQDNALGLSSYIMAARIGYNPNTIVSAMKGRIATAKPNFVIIDDNHGLEKTTPIEVINSMMLLTVDSIMYVFPNWIDKPASFTRLRAKGAFIVSAEISNSKVYSLSILSEIGTPCKVKNPWPGNKLNVIETLHGVSAVIPATTANDVYSFATKIGATYTFDISTGVEKVTNSSAMFKVNPNPADTKIQIQLLDPNQINEEVVRVSDLGGHTLISKKISKNQKQLIIDMSEHPAGVYLVSYKGSSVKVILTKSVK